MKYEEFEQINEYGDMVKYIKIYRTESDITIFAQDKNNPLYQEYLEWLSNQPK